MIKQFFIYFLLLLISFSSLNAQGPPPFWDDIKKFKSTDSINTPPENAILFIGSSSFTMWKGLQDSFPAYTVINRGFGGSTLPDQIRYENKIIFPYKPRQIVIYCGENDIASSDSITGEIVLRRFRQLYNDIREKYPHVMVSYISMKPSPSRWSMKERLITGNSLINQFLDGQPNAHFINIWDVMIGPDGRPKEELFTKDMLHLNQKGYALWKQIIEPYLLK
jgi:lysophospholipase L1-like esterase